MARLVLRTERPDDETVCVALGGELDLSSAYRFDAELRRIEATGPETVIVDLRDLVFMDSAGLSRLLAAHLRARRGGWRFGLVPGSEPVQRMLQLTATHERFVTLSDPAALVI
jgi:anti-sigma B factor antagonist